MGTKETFDTAFDNIVLTLRTYSDAQIAAEQFIVRPDYWRYFNQFTGAGVFPHMGNITPQPGKSGVGAHYAYDADYYLDCIAAGKGVQGESDYTRATEAAGIRLRYLIKQVIEALYKPGNYNLGFTGNEIGKRPFPRVEFLPPEMLPTEHPIVGARMTITLSMAYEPTRQTGTAIDKISVTADDWLAMLEP